ncbi:MAG: DUF2614 family zinc ribbon-containing protein [Bacillota bacterium]|nr:hypothetical protein [Bacillota bacterium]
MIIFREGATTMGVVIGLFLLTFVILFLLAMYKTITSYRAIRRPPIACPACGRHTHVWGKRSVCTRCNASLERQQDGTWQVKKKP